MLCVARTFLVALQRRGGATHHGAKVGKGADVLLNRRLRRVYLMMARKDFYHECVRRALVKDGWTITHEPLLLPFADTRLEVDLGAERSGAERSAVLIAVEVKNFLENKPMVSEYQKSHGQYQLYREILRSLDPMRTLYLAIPEPAYHRVFSNPIIQRLLQASEVQLLLFDPETETITQWNP